MILLGQTGVADDELAPVEYVVTDESVEELPHPLPELLALPLHLLDRLGEAVRVLDLATLEVTPVLVLVVAGHAQGVARADHGHHPTQDARGVRAAVDEVPDEDGRTALRVRPVDVTELAEQAFQF